MQVKGLKEPYLNFLRELMIQMLTEHGSVPLRRRNLPGGSAKEFLPNDGINR
jgi:hypothetical protein